MSDAVRLRRLHATGLLGAGGTLPSLDRLAWTAAHQLRCDRAQVALVAADRRVVIGQAGPPVDRTLCRMVVDADAPVLVCDARAEERVTDDGVIAYAGYPLRSADGYPLGAFCVLDRRPRDWEPRELLLIEDLAAAAETELALRARLGEEAAAAERLRSVLGNCLEAYVSIDGAGAVTAWNLAAERLFGYPAAEAVGRLVAELIIPERFHSAHAAGLARLHSGGVSTLAGQRVELTGRNRAGAEFPIEMTLQQGPDGFHAFLHDITGRLGARRQLEHDRMFLQALLDSLNTGVAACDEGGRLTQFNRAMRGVHGDDPQPIVPPAWPATFDLLRPDGRTPLAPDETPLARAYAGQQVDGQEVVVAPPDRPARTFDVNARPIMSEDGRRLGAVVAMHDVTEQRRALADQRRQNEQLRQLDRLKDELIALVSHELRNPLGAIRSYSETLLEDEELTGEQRHLAEVIDRRSAHMQALVDDLLDLARLEAGRLPIDPKPMSAVRLIRDVVQTQLPAARAKDLTVTVAAPRHVPVEADPVRLRQVLDNLLSNAVKYTPAGGTVTISAAHDDAEAVLTVADSGIGIPADQYPHLFDRFFRAENAVRQGIKGTGLGLAITKAIVEAHGGRITAAPGAAGGTTFTVVLPAGGER